MKRTLVFVFCLIGVFISNSSRADLFKCVGQNGHIDYTNVITPGCEKLKAFDERWESLGLDDYQNEIYFDTQSVLHKGSIIDVWMLFTQSPNSDYKKLIRINCSNRSYAILQGQGKILNLYNKDYYEQIAPESGVELAFTKLCSGK